MLAVVVNDSIELFFSNLVTIAGSSHQPGSLGAPRPDPGKLFFSDFLLYKLLLAEDVNLSIEALHRFNLSGRHCVPLLPVAVFFIVSNIDGVIEVPLHLSTSHVQVHVCSRVTRNC